MNISKPYDFLNQLLGKEAQIKLKDGTMIKGKVLAFDVHMNLVVQLQEELSQRYIFIRGDSLMFVERIE
ncbi:MAG: hypothetical protein GXN92_03130 [Candidatus Micrarchaeota archaeon]|nr:hypothetical protein [Candidatus Micrarchaeota archaeon]